MPVEPSREKQTHRIRVLLVDDHPLFRDGVGRRLREGMEVKGNNGRGYDMIMAGEIVVQT